MMVVLSLCITEPKRKSANDSTVCAARR
jgi:hypothetical protein